MKTALGYARFKAVVTDGKGGRATATGSECAADFNDYIEKAETESVGRALAMLGYGTQFAPEMAEGERLADAPVEHPQPPTQLKRVPDQLQTSHLDALKLRAVKVGWIQGADREAMRIAWDARMAEIFGGPPLPEDYGKASVLGQIEASIELYVQAHPTDKAS